MLIAIPKHKLNFYLEMDTAFSQLALQQVKYCMTVYRWAPGPYNYQDFTLPVHVKGRFHLWAPPVMFLKQITIQLHVMNPGYMETAIGL